MHTVESLMQLIRKFARSDMEPNYSKYEQLVREAVTEVLAEQENVRKANLDCVDHFNQLKEDYDKLLEERKFAYMEGYDNGVTVTRDDFHDHVDELTKDKQRLDWFNSGEGVFRVANTWYYKPTYFKPAKKHKDVRAAIDAGMKGTP